MPRMATKERPRQVWDHQPEEGETQAPWAAFRAFRDGPKPRNLREHAQRLGLSYATMQTWSSEFCWFERAAAYDTHQDQLAQQAAETAVQRMARRHLYVASLARRVAAKALAGHLKDLAAGDAPVTPQAAARLLKEAAHLERLTLGEATERVAGVGDLRRLSDEELLLAEALQKKARGE